MFKLARLTDYAVVLLLDLGHMRTTQTAHVLSERTAIPLPTVQKVLKQLASGGIVESQQGKAGGYHLKKPAQNITLADILSVMEGPVSLTACVDGAEGCCTVEQICAARGRWDMVNDAIKGTLSSVTLADMLASVTASLPFQPSPSPQSQPSQETRHAR